MSVSSTNNNSKNDKLITKSSNIMENKSLTIKNRDFTFDLKESTLKNYRQLKEFLNTVYETNNPNFMLESSHISVYEIMQILETNENDGLALNKENDESRLLVFGKNHVPPQKRASFFVLFLNSLKDKFIILLLIAATISLSLGIYQDYTIKKPNETKYGWVEGVAILTAVLVVLLFGSINDWQKEKQFAKLNAKKENITVNVKRNKELSRINQTEITVGDVILCEPGHIVPVDGILLDGFNIFVDESSITGESEAIRKQPYSNQKDSSEISESLILSGAKVLEGTGCYLATRVGVDSLLGQAKISTRYKSSETPLQEKLNKLAGSITKACISAAIVMLLGLLLKYFLIDKNQFRSLTTTKDMIKIIIDTITIIVVGIPEGLPLAVTVVLATTTKKLLKQNNLVRVLSSCETMGSATTICSDKTGTLTQNKMTVVCGSFGNEEGEYNVGRFFHEKATEELKKITTTSIAVNSSAFFDAKSKKLVGSNTECALINFVFDKKNQINELLRKYRSEYSVVHVFPFDSRMKYMATVVKLDENPTNYRVFLNGAPEIILSKCKAAVTNNIVKTSHLELVEIDSPKIKDTINQYASKSLRTFAISYKDISWEDVTKKLGDLGDSFQNKMWNELVRNSSDMNFVGVFGIEDPLREGVVDAIKQCYNAGVTVRMVTGDNLTTAKAISIQCGIFQKDSGLIAMEGSQFRNLNEYQMMYVVPKLRVLARSSPQDKMLLVETLKKMNEVVAVTGDGTNDAPALRAADVGFSMGLSGTEIAKEASSIVLLDDNFNSIVDALLWGRNVTVSVKKFIQFQLTVNLTAMAAKLITSIFNRAPSFAENEGDVFTAVQLLWINMIMDTLAALAFANDYPNKSLLNQLPQSRQKPLISSEMWKMIIGQSLYQLITCCFLFYFLGTVYNNKLIVNTLVFNTFVMMQIFNQVNSRSINNNINIFKDITKNKMFIAIATTVFIVQVIIVEFGGIVFSTSGLNIIEWSISIAFGVFSIPLGFVLRKTPNISLTTKFKRSKLSKRDTNETLNAYLNNSNIATNKKHARMLKAAIIPNIVASSLGPTDFSDK